MCEKYTTKKHLLNIKCLIVNNWYPFQDFRNFLHVTFNNRGSNDWNRPLWLNWRMPEVYIQWLYINPFIRTFFLLHSGEVEVQKDILLYLTPIWHKMDVFYESHRVYLLVLYKNDIFLTMCEIFYFFYLSFI